MKKITLIKAVAIGAAILFAVPAFAATTATLSLNAATVAAGSSFTVTVAVDPAKTANYAEKLVLDYPADMLEATSFTYGSTWMPLTQSGYDSIDNSKGVLMKTAGYPSGITSLTTFGTVTFRAKHAGSGTITIDSGAQAFEGNTPSALTGNTVSFTATEPAMKIVKASATEVAPESANTAISPIGLGAAAAGAGISFTHKAWFWILMILVVLVLGYVGRKAYRASKKEKVQ